MVRIVQFEIEGHRVGLPAGDVVEVVRAATASPLPGAPAVVVGLLNVRGALVPVFDVRARLGLPQRPMRAADHLVLAEGGGRRVAICVGDIHGLVEVEAAAIEAADALTVGSVHVAGVARLADGLMVILDLASFLTAAEAAQLDEALGT